MGKVRFPWQMFALCSAYPFLNEWHHHHGITIQCQRELTEEIFLCLSLQIGIDFVLSLITAAEEEFYLWAHLACFMKCSPHDSNLCDLLTLSVHIMSLPCHDSIVSNGLDLVGFMMEEK